ncbi:unnamed protein product [Caenorhabditis bovis]|uniref:G-protein coupled receptors family 1 profile domain-containing protein n=1 Tax=Caenorhabditis bovis TaxID=2654633 RepID=A0A8S1F740_9PELO|nr:unnamed protein product [Caenorhabditis bovis]
MHAFYAMSIVSLPIYFIVFVSLLRLRCYSKVYNTTFYTIFLQHCIADFIAIISFYFVNPLRTIPFIKRFYFDYQEYYIAAMCYNSIYVCLYIRCTGVIFLSIHRFVVIALPTSTMSITLQNANKLIIIAIFWLLPMPLCVVVLKDTDFYYESYETLLLIAQREVINRNTLMALIVTIFTCATCSLCYGGLFYVVRKKSAMLSRTLRRELHLAFQVLALLLAFFAILMYYSFQNYFAQTHNTGPIFLMRSIYPLANGLLSFVNPYCILFLNREFAIQVRRSLRCKTFKVSEIHMSTTTPSKTRHR